MTEELSEHDQLIDRSMDADQHVLEVVFQVLAEHEDHECESMEHLRDAVMHSIEAWEDLDRAETKEQFDAIVNAEFKEEE